MRISRTATYALGVLAAAALVAGCSGTGSQSGALAPTTVGSAAHHAAPLHRGLQDTYISVKPFSVHPSHKKSWISPAVKDAPRILFQSDSGTDVVYVFTLPDLSLKGTLTGFSEPQGECSDSSGNIYITNTGTEQVFEYSRTGILINTFDDSTGYPVGCAVWGNDLAVTNIFDFSGPGSVLVYSISNPTSTPTSLSNPDQYYYYFDGYDTSGDIWVSGRDDSGVYILSVCAAGGTSCSTLSLSDGTIYFPGAVQYSSVNNSWYAFDQECGDTEAACGYPVSASGVLGAEIPLSNYEGGSACDVVQATIGAPYGQKYLAGGDYEYCGYTASTTNRWGFPGGGTPSWYNDSAGQDVPIGAAISAK
ncbi:MAG TPA: hypothetical protein VFF63_02085 [Candidatus Babeliales bacterium]|nr:hypothetical protein [Candidatus Babeliales bacterium]